MKKLTTHSPEIQYIKYLHVIGPNYIPRRSQIRHSHLFSNNTVTCALHGSTIQSPEPFKLCKLSCPSAFIASTFWHRVVNMWNALPENIVAATSLAMFKAQLNDFDLVRFTSVF